MADVLAALADRMVRSRTIGFIGAGYSARSGYPTWGQLIDDLYHRASVYGDELPRPDAPDVDKRWAAEMYANVLERHGSLTATLRDSFGRTLERNGVGVAELDRLQLLVARLPFNHFITTNYDGLLEQACDRVFEVTEGREPSDWERCLARDGREDSQFSDFLGSMVDTRRSALHLHGRLEGNQLTLSMGEYDKQYLHDAMLLRMFSIFATSTVVFIGASLYDADIMELLRRSTFHTNRRTRHYAFLPHTREGDREMLRASFGVEPIFYRVRPAHENSEPDDHTELEWKLERLLELVEAARPDADRRVDGNVTPVRTDYGDGFENVVELVKDGVRQTESGPAVIAFPSELGIEPGGVAGSRVLRRVAIDYRELPTTYRFRHVVWISPGRIGLFPGPSRSRQVVDAIIGEVTYALGRHRATATVDRHQNIRSIRQILGNTRWHRDHEPTLFVIDGSRELRTYAGEDEAALTSLLYALPSESVAIFEEPAEAPHAGAESRSPTWAQLGYEAAIDELFADAPDAEVVEEADPPVELDPPTAGAIDEPAEVGLAGSRHVEPSAPSLAGERHTSADAQGVDDVIGEDAAGTDATGNVPAEDDAAGTDAIEDDAIGTDAIEDVHRTNEQRVLVALCVVATPISSGHLTTILEIDKHEVERVIEALRDRGLIESPGQESENDGYRLVAPCEDVPEPQSVDVGLLNPVRAATLRLLSQPSGPPKRVLVEVVGTILAWVEATIEQLHGWEDDREQLDELIEHLPNMLAVFEAGCWLSSSRQYLSTAFSNCHLWLGTDLAYVLYTVGRWAEAGQLLRYLERHVDAVTEPATFEREVRILLAAFYGHAGRPESDYPLACEQANIAISLAEAGDGLGDECRSGLSYAPVRLTRSRQLARAKLWRAHAVIRSLAHVEDRKLAARLAKGDAKQADEDLDWICDGGFEDDEARRGQEESLRIIGHAAEARGELRLVERRARRVERTPRDSLAGLERDTFEDDDATELLRVLQELDQGRAAAGRIQCRPRGYHAKLRGEMLLDHGNYAAARRCFARTLLISYEFKDRYLEASALLGLARCDRRRELAQRAADIFKDLRRDAEAKEAEFWSWNPQMSGDDNEARLRRYPNLVVIVGIPGSGKSAAVSTASTVLAEWGFDPVRPRFTPRLMERIRAEEELDLSKVSSDLADLRILGTKDAGDERRVIIVKVPTGRLLDLFTAWCDKPFQMRSMICIHLTAPSGVLARRNERRRSGQLPTERLERMIRAENDQTKLQRDTHSSWETWFQHNRSAYVSIYNEIPITEFEHRVKDALALSYLPVDDLISASRYRFEYTPVL